MKRDRRFALGPLVACLFALGPSLACPKSEPPSPPPADGGVPGDDGGEIETVALNEDGRPEEDVVRDPRRKPQEVMDFFEIREGSRVVELMTGRGYYAELLAKRVGPTGKVWAHNSPFVLQRFAEGPISERLDRLDLDYLQRLDTPLDASELPPDLDAVLIILFYHDTYWQEVDRAAMNRQIFAALKPGGVYGVIDHSAVAGAGDTAVQTLHRVEESLVRQEILDAGFVLDAESDILRHPEDPRTHSVFDVTDETRDLTDRFVLRFRKPLDAGTVPAGE